MAGNSFRFNATACTASYKKSNFISDPVRLSTRLAKDDPVLSARRLPPPPWKRGARPLGWGFVWQAPAPAPVVHIRPPLPIIRPGPPTLYSASEPSCCFDDVHRAIECEGCRMDLIFWVLFGHVIVVWMGVSAFDRPAVARVRCCRTDAYLDYCDMSLLPEYLQGF
ncbi:hypothetical protein VTN77DRAFT_4575 [Rasamsonia byssochlamydoides]|uniref:uncharacterized protein n=1 Tax=Rasamsonia byssochlamydoides TaxID=89139 RepID=UPI00374272B0